MKLIFTKGSGKFDDLLIHRADGSTDQISCPKQGIIPHDMVHYAVESILSRSGFLSRIAAGEAADFRMSKNTISEAIERLVEAMQADAWSGNASASDILDMYAMGCQARDHEYIPVTDDQIDLIRREMAQLAIRWNAVKIGGSMTLYLDGAAG